ncbi:MAG: sigma-54-dependent Fis family transcriptional regulator [Nitrospirota bacterium]|nr:MAG: sigma-54-dependent Fis family transcriptional regulator [Nitrospirota bacterium]
MTPAHILVIDDEEILLKSCQRSLEPLGHTVVTTRSPEEGLKILEDQRFDLVLSDLRMPHMDGLDVLRNVKENWPDTEVIIITGHGTVNTAVSAMKTGAFDYIEKPFTPDTLNIIVERALKTRQIYIEHAQLKKEVRSFYIKNIIGKSPAMENVYKLIDSVTSTASTVLITGESGTGKELVARAIHFNSPRSDDSFMVLDCGTLSENLIESELFGHMKGSFTGATENKVGLLEAADKGTLFLDEIGNLPMQLQTKLLRVLQEKEFRPIGAKRSNKVDVRFIAATNRDLKEMVDNGEFREDLYYRLNIFPIHVPSLSERREDIPLLSYHFLGKFESELGLKVDNIDADAMNILINYDWPGNVRELENAIHRAMLLSETGIITPSQLIFLDEAVRGGIPGTAEELKEIKKRLRSRSIESVEKAFVISALERNDWNVSKAARSVGMQRTNLHALIRKYDVPMKEKDAEEQGDEA